MKRFLILVLLILTFVAFADAANLQFGWDPKPAGDARNRVRVYERTGSAAPYSYNWVGEVLEPTQSFTLNGVPAGSHVYVARGFNGQTESGDSNAVSVVIVAIPGAVTNLTVTFVP